MKKTPRNAVGSLCIPNGLELGEAIARDLAACRGKGRAITGIALASRTYAQHPLATAGTFELAGVNYPVELADDLPQGHYLILWQLFPADSVLPAPERFQPVTEDMEALTVQATAPLWRQAALPFGA